jgi:putative peptidoglycan lipid II flippase
VKVFSTAYWSQQDTVSPVKISVVTTGINVVLSLILIFPFGVAGIAISTGLVGWLQLILLYRGLRAQASLQFDKRFKKAIFRIVFSTLFMAVILLVADKYLRGFIYEGEMAKIAVLIALVILGLISYGLSVITTKAVSIDEIRKYLLPKKAIKESDL